MLPSIFSENLFDDFFNSAMFPKAEHELYGKHAKNLMNTDVREVENGYEIDMNLPGFKKDEVEIQLQDGCLTVSAAKGLDKDEEDKKGRYIRQERYAGSMSRSFYVGEDVEPQDVKAKFEDGVLSCSSPRPRSSRCLLRPLSPLSDQMAGARKGGSRPVSFNGGPASYFRPGSGRGYETRSNGSTGGKLDPPLFP